MHTASLGERVAEVASRTTDPVLRQVGLTRIDENNHMAVILTVLINIMAVVIIISIMTITKPDLNSLSLSVWVVLLFPSSEVSAGDSFVLSNKILIAAKRGSHLDHFIPEAPKVQGTWRKTLPDSRDRP